MTKFPDGAFAAIIVMLFGNGCGSSGTPGLHKIVPRYYDDIACFSSQPPKKGTKPRPYKQGHLPIYPI